MDYDGTYISTTPEGTLAASASTSTQKLELVNGQLQVNGSTLNSSGGSSVDLSNYYTKTETENEIDNSINGFTQALEEGRINVNAPNYYTKSEVNDLIIDMAETSITDTLEEKIDNLEDSIDSRIAAYMTANYENGDNGSY